jgi:hypothetical protein
MFVEAKTITGATPQTSRAVEQEGLKRPISIAEHIIAPHACIDLGGWSTKLSHIREAGQENQNVFHGGQALGRFFGSERNRYPEAEWLKQIKGVGTLIALTYMLTLEDSHRLRKSRNAACYAVPCSSGLYFPSLHRPPKRCPAQVSKSALRPSMASRMRRGRTRLIGRSRGLR